MSLDNTEDELVVTRAPIDTSKPSYKPATATLSSSISTPKTTSTSALSPSDTVPSTIKNQEVERIYN